MAKFAHLPILVDRTYYLPWNFAIRRPACLKPKPLNSRQDTRQGRCLGSGCRHRGLGDAPGALALFRRRKQHRFKQRQALAAVLR
jgi:hypothetical protein